MKHPKELKRRSSGVGASNLIALIFGIPIILIALSAVAFVICRQPGGSCSDSDDDIPDIPEWQSEPILIKNISETDPTPDDPTRDTVAVAEQTATLSEYLATRDQSKPVIIAVANGGFADMAANFLCSLRRTGIKDENILMLATDREGYQLLRGAGYPAYQLNLTVATDAKTWGTPGFKSFVREKVKAVLSIVEMGHDIMFVDTDVVFLRNIYEVLLPAARQGGQMLIDNVKIGVLDGTPDANNSNIWDYAIYHYKSHSNTGFYYMKSNPRTIKLMQSWISCMRRVTLDDQDTFDGMFDRGLRPKRAARVGSAAVKCRDLRVFLYRLLIASPVYFPSATDYFNDKTPQKRHATPFIVHNNQIFGKHRKVKRFQDFKLWFIDDKLQCNMG
eukprot:TRINITY_DN14057_c0_g1_i1.p1 TRINITY_DN14057_c0_g1~~TRINITY_DN14057_c0_g1_i1.p1  ORF type:complete len:389 (-),score=32.18 TRINITY_DN14057_c0_g1_i1:1233-2399(-)